MRLSVTPDDVSARRPELRPVAYRCRVRVPARRSFTDANSNRKTSRSISRERLPRDARRPRPHLGVTAASLRRLALGWAPIVTFKKGPNFSGWWAIPERDADGVPIGISLRSQSDMKVMYPGSKHGLVYEVNPKHERGGEGYAAGASNGSGRWSRRPVPCVSASLTAACSTRTNLPTRKPSASARRPWCENSPMKFGYLHILKAEGVQRIVTALADTAGRSSSWRG
jgi:hypothetical protein